MTSQFVTAAASPRLYKPIRPCLGTNQHTRTFASPVVVAPDHGGSATSPRHAPLRLATCHIRHTHCMIISLLIVINIY